MIDTNEMYSPRLYDRHLIMADPSDPYNLSWSEKKRAINLSSITPIAIEL